MLCPVLDPVKAHVFGFRPFLFDGVVCKTFGGGVIYIDGGGQLGMAEFGKGGMNGDSLLAVEEGISDFGFCGGRHNVAHDLGDGMDGAVEGWTGVGSTGRVQGAVDKDVVPDGAAPCLWLQKIRGVAVDMEDHVTGRIADVHARMGGGVVEEPEDLIICLLGGLGLLGVNRSKGGKHGRVDGDGVVQLGDDDLLDEGDGLGWQDRRFLGLLAHWTVAPYMGFFQAWGESWEHDGVICWNLWRAEGR